MRKASFAILLLVIVPICLGGQGQQNTAVISVDSAHPGAAISPEMFGIFFEDINFGADGGLYPELVKNRSFEFNEPLTGWHADDGLHSKGLDSTRANSTSAPDAPLNASQPALSADARLRAGLWLLERRLPRDGSRERSRIPLLRLCPHRRAEVAIRFTITDAERQ